MSSDVIPGGGPRPHGDARDMTTADNDIVSRQSAHSIDATVDRLEGLLAQKGITLFALIDHSGEAAKAGLDMRPTKLLIVGSPRAGTPLMLASPTSAIDLPLKILVWEDAQHVVWISTNSASYMERRHHIPAYMLRAIKAVDEIVSWSAR